MKVPNDKHQISNKFQMENYQIRNGVTAKNQGFRQIQQNTFYFTYMPYGQMCSPFHTYSTEINALRAKSGNEQIARRASISIEAFS
jgi:hypothetical protein